MWFTLTQTLDGHSIGPGSRAVVFQSLGCKSLYSAVIVVEPRKSEFNLTVLQYGELCAICITVLLPLCERCVHVLSLMPGLDRLPVSVLEPKMT